jgi:hypothetical protein
MALLDGEKYYITSTYNKLVIDTNYNAKLSKKIGAFLLLASTLLPILASLGVKAGDSNPLDKCVQSNITNDNLTVDALDTNNKKYVGGLSARIDNWGDKDTKAYLDSINDENKKRSEACIDYLANPSIGFSLTDWISSIFGKPGVKNIEPRPPSNIKTNNKDNLDTSKYFNKPPSLNEKLPDNTQYSKPSTPKIPDTPQRTTDIYHNPVLKIEEPKYPNNSNNTSEANYNRPEPNSLKSTNTQTNINHNSNQTLVEANQQYNRAIETTNNQTNKNSTLNSALSAVEEQEVKERQNAQNAINSAIKF